MCPYWFLSDVFLCRFSQWYQMPLQRAALYLLVQFEDVVCQCQQNGLTQDIRTPSRKKAAKSKGSLDLCKDTLYLDAAVHPQDDSFRALDPCEE